MKNTCLKTIQGLFFILSISGCSKGFQASSSTLVSGSSSQASTGTPGLGLNCRSPFVLNKMSTLEAPGKIPQFFAQSKLDPLDWSSSNSVSGAFGKASLNGAPALANKLTVKIDPVCARAIGLPQEFSFSARDADLLSKDMASGSYSVSLNRELNPDELNSLLNSNSCISAASPETRIFKSALPNDPFLSSQPYLNLIGFDKSYDFYSDAQYGVKNDIVIAVIDDGIDLSHIDLRDRLWVNVAELNGQAGVDDDNNGYIDDINGFDFASNVADPGHKLGAMHGSHVAGLIAATGNNNIGMTGVSGLHGRLMILNVFGATDSTDSTLIERAIAYAVSNGAKVINMSLGGAGRVATTGAAIANAVSQGVFVVAAAGNDGIQLSAANFVTPASFASSIQGFVSVGASDVVAPTSLCFFSNFSATEVEISAPGCDSSRADLGIFSTLPGNLGGFLAGTSMASPIVAGSAALIASMVRDEGKVNIAPAALEALMTNSSVKTNALLTRVVGGNQLSVSNAAQTLFNDYLKAIQICE